MPNHPHDDSILENFAREIVEGCEGVIANGEMLAAELLDETPVDCEAFRVALFYVRRVLAAAAWLEPIKHIRVEKI